MPFRIPRTKPISINSHGKLEAPISKSLKGKSGIYLIRNKETKQVYVGKTSDIYRRFFEHLRYAQSPDTESLLISQAVHTNPTNFEFKVFKIYKKGISLSPIEKKVIQLFDSVHNGYNCNGGGGGGSPHKRVRIDLENLPSLPTTPIRRYFVGQPLTPTADTRNVIYALRDPQGRALYGNTSQAAKKRFSQHILRKHLPKGTALEIWAMCKSPSQLRATEIKIIAENTLSHPDLVLNKNKGGGGSGPSRQGASASESEAPVVGQKRAARSLDSPIARRLF